MINCTAVAPPVAPVKPTNAQCPPSNCPRSSGAEPPQVGTYEFRLHRHYHPLVFAGPPDPSYTGPTALLNWLIVDFLRPDVNRWVTDLAGATTIVPDVGHY